MLDALVALVTGAAFALGYILVRGLDPALEARRRSGPAPRSFGWKNRRRCAIMGKTQEVGTMEPTFSDNAPAGREGQPSGAHILACLSPAPSNGRILRAAARMAVAFNATFTALFVQTPDFAGADEAEKQHLEANQKLARQLGASVETVFGEDVAYQIGEYARLSGVTTILLGRSLARRRLFARPALTERLLAQTPDIDIHILPDRDAVQAPRRAERPRARTVLKNAAMCVAILLCSTALSILFDRLGFTDANIIMVYILGVLLTSVLAPHPAYSLATSAASVLIFNFLFTLPRFSLRAYGTGYPVTFVVMFLTAYITGTFALRCRRQARQSASIAHRTKILFDTDRLLAAADSREEIIRTTARQLVKLLDRDVVVFENRDGALSDPWPFRKGGVGVWQDHTGAEQAAAEWVLRNRRTAGAGTDTFPQARCTYFALRVNERVYGVVGIGAEDAPLDPWEHSILLSILGEGALALENEGNAREKEEAAVRAEREQLRANLLRTISHDLRTPLTTISGNAANLLRSGDSFDEQTKRRIYADIHDDAVWLITLVENLLYATRIEDGRMTLRTSTELLSELMEEAVAHIGRKAADHPIHTALEEEVLLVRADARLIVQVIANILDNAIKYTRPGTPITLRARRAGDMAQVLIADQGDGIPEEEKALIFQKFYRGGSAADSRRSLGLGLYLCQEIVRAHGGTIQVEDNVPHGALFRFTLPAQEATPYE